MSSLPEARRFTVAEYLKLGDAGILRPQERVELLDGVIVAMSPQGPAQSAVVAQLLPRMLDWFPRDRFCVRPQSTLPLLDDFSPEPDLAVVVGRCEEHRAAYPTKAVLIVEVSDSSVRLDRGRKAELYAAAGVPEHWVVNIADRVVEVYREPAAGGYAERRRLAAGEGLLPSGLEASDTRSLAVAELLPR